MDDCLFNDSKIKNISDLIIYNSLEALKKTSAGIKLFLLT